VVDSLNANKMSERMRVNGFKKEFAATLSYIKHREQMLLGAAADDYGANNSNKPKKFDVKKEKIGFDLTALLMHSMGFL
jgi:hypothetical protein